MNDQNKASYFKKKDYVERLTILDIVVLAWSIFHFSGCWRGRKKKKWFETKGLRTFTIHALCADSLSFLGRRAQGGGRYTSCPNIQAVSYRAADRVSRYAIPVSSSRRSTPPPQETPQFRGTHREHNAKSTSHRLPLDCLAKPNNGSDLIALYTCNARAIFIIIIHDKSASWNPSLWKQT